MKPSQRSIALIRKLARRATDSNEKSLFGLLSLIERKMYKPGRAGIEGAIRKAQDAGRITLRLRTIHKISHYIE